MSKKFVWKGNQLYMHGKLVRQNTKKFRETARTQSEGAIGAAARMLVEAASEAFVSLAILHEGSRPKHRRAYRKIWRGVAVTVRKHSVSVVPVTRRRKK